MTENPEQATWNGYPGQNNRWSDLSNEAIARHKRETRTVFTVLNSLNRSKLTPGQRTSYDILKYDLGEQVTEQRFPGELLELNQLGGIQIDTAQLFNVAPATTLKDYEDMLARFERFPEHMEQVIALLTEGLKRNITPPKITLRDVPEQIKAQLVSDAAESPVLSAFKKFPTGFSAADQKRLLERAKMLFHSSITPAYQKLLKFVTEQYIPGCREETAFSALPDGKEWYAAMIRLNTTTQLSARQVHNIGLSEVKRIRGEMDKVIEKVQFKGDFKKFSEFLRTDPRFYFNTREEILKTSRDIAKRIDPELIKLFGKLPRLPYGVSPVPEYSEKSQPAGYYESGSLSPGRPGIIYINTYDLKSRPSWGLETLIAHESVPGHHLQAALALEMKDVPEFRKFNWYTAYGEGWALYAESLGYEIGLYQDPYSNFGHLSDEILRAIRLVVDTGMHELGWSRQQAIDYFLANSPTPEHEVIVEIDRYLVWPGQALGYKIGQLKIKELRERYHDKLGDKFDLRSFHDAVLENANVPLDVLESNIADWASRRSQKSEKEITSGL